MKKNGYLWLCLILVLFSSTFILSADGAKNISVMPLPLKTETGNGQFRLDEKFVVSVSNNASDRLCSAASRALRRISGKTGLFFQQDYVRTGEASENASLKIIVERTGKIKLHEDESYTLTIEPGGISLKAVTDLGALHGLETLVQLVDKDKDGYLLPALKIEDAPRFAWRGLMIDACRHFMPVEMIKRNIDAMAAVKLNVFHWHLSEDQGFRVESKTFPKLTGLGSDGLFYTQSEIKDIIKYAEDRGISVVPEFDIPGHSTAWFAGYPELASAPGPYKVERKWGVFDPVFDPTNEETYKFFDAFFKEMSELFPNEYMHIGGDENNGKDWKKNEKIQEYMKAHNIPDAHALQAYFNKRILEILTKYNKKMIGWDEILHPDMPKNIIIQSWRGVKSLKESAQKGYQALLSNGYYIDLCYSTATHYLNDPLPENLNLSDDEKKFILGGEATMWAELVSPENVDSRIWPRTAAIAERFWSAQNVKDVRDMYRRLPAISRELEDVGALHLKNRGSMIRRLIGYDDNSALLTLLGVIEPVKEYSRHSQGKSYNSYSPLTRVVDIAVPDADDARNFGFAVDDFLAGKVELEKEITTWLQCWKDNKAKLLLLIDKNPVLKEIEPLSNSLSDIAELGMDAMKQIKAHNKASQDRISIALQKIKKAQEPAGQAELANLSAIEKLKKKSGE